MYEMDNNMRNSSIEDAKTTPVTPGMSAEQIKKQKKAEKKAARKAARKKNWKKIGIAAALGLSFGIMAGGAFQCINRVADHFFPTGSKVEAAAQEDTKQEVAADDKEGEIPTAPTAKDNESTATLAGFKSSDELTVTEIAENSMPFVVSITNKSVQQVRSMFGMGIQEYENTSVGSGIILDENDKELLIVTNNHVIEGASSLTVGFVDDEVYEAYVKGTDSDRDIAVIAVDLTTLSDDTKGSISIAPLGDSADLKVGEQVVAIGNALGYGQSVTTGIVSALDREVTIDNITNSLIQTDTAINPGNSGGALINMKGELIGINSAKFASASVEGMGYAIPIDTVKPIVGDLMNRETRSLLDESEAGYLGITGVNVDSSISEAYGIPEGVYLQEVADGSPAEKAGLIKGDVITKFDKTSVNSIAELKNMLLYYKAGEQVEVVFYRADNGQYTEKTITVTLGDRKGTALDPGKAEKDTDDSNSSEDTEENTAPDERENSGPEHFEDIEDFGSLFDYFTRQYRQ